MKKSSYLFRFPQWIHPFFRFVSRVHIPPMQQTDQYLHFFDHILEVNKLDRPKLIRSFIRCWWSILSYSNRSMTKSHMSNIIQWIIILVFITFEFRYASYFIIDQWIGIIVYGRRKQKHIHKIWKISVPDSVTDTIKMLIWWQTEMSATPLFGWGRREFFSRLFSLYQSWLDFPVILFVGNLSSSSSSSSFSSSLVLRKLISAMCLRFSLA